MEHGHVGPDLEVLWISALSDAEIDPADALLFAFDGIESAGGYGGKTWLRDSDIDDPEDREVFGSALRQANGNHVRGLRRVAIWLGRSTEGTAAAMRHELEHSLQFDVHGEILQHLHERAVEVLIEHAGGRPGSNALYNRIPMEADANDAAASFVRSTFGDARIDVLVDAGDCDSALFRTVAGARSAASLQERMETFVNVDGPTLAKAFAAAADEPSVD